jgi:DNA helicase HerA-like ATPase
VVKRLLNRLRRFGIFDSTDDLLDVGDFIKAGKVSVLDLSNSYTVQVNNIVIAYLLRKIFDSKISNPDLPPTIIFIEEAHTFVSKENASKMEALLDRLREVTRRGRKRWLGLCFISQQPSHLPEEIFELCNTKIIHQTTGNRNLNALKISGGNVNEAIWDDVPTLGQGRSIIISPQFQHPIMTNMRICKTNREHTD